MLRCILCFNPIIESRSFDTEKKHNGSLTVLDLINLHFGFTDVILKLISILLIFQLVVFVSIQEDVGNNPNEKRMCKRCYTNLTNFHELYCLVKTNYNSFPEEALPLFEVIVTKTEEEKLKGMDKFHKFN